MSNDRDEQFRRLAELNADDLLTAFGMTRVGRRRSVLRRLCRLPAERFAHEIVAYDAAVGQGGLAAGGRLVLQKWRIETTFHGLEHVPAEGPVLLLSNHPGLTDTMALFAAIPRTDLRIIAAERILLRSLPNTLPFLFFADERVARRQAVVRAATRHLRQGGALLTFPAGQIEPDPALERKEAADSLLTWQGHFEIFLRLVPNLTVVPIIVDGVISPRAQRNPLTRLRRHKRDRDWLAATLQVVIRRYQQVHVTVTFGAPIRPTEDSNVDAMAEAVLAEAHRIIIARGPHV